KKRKPQSARNYYRSVITKMGQAPVKEEDEGGHGEQGEQEEIEEPRVYNQLFPLLKPNEISWYVGARCFSTIEKEEISEKPLVRIPIGGFYSYSTLLIPLELGLRIIVNKPN